MLPGISALGAVEVASAHGEATVLVVATNGTVVVVRDVEECYVVNVLTLRPWTRHLAWRGVWLWCSLRDSNNRAGRKKRGLAIRACGVRFTMLPAKGGHRRWPPSLAVPQAGGTRGCAGAGSCVCGTLELVTGVETAMEEATPAPPGLTPARAIDKCTGSRPVAELGRRLRRYLCSPRPSQRTVYPVEMATSKHAAVGANA